VIEMVGRADDLIGAGCGCCRRLSLSCLGALLLWHMLDLMGGNLGISRFHSSILIFSCGLAPL